MQGKEPKPDVNYDLGDNVENDHWQSVSLDNTAEGFNSDDETRQSLYYLWWASLNEVELPNQSISISERSKFLRRLKP